ncbi:hypothetical protein [Mycolicibacterium fortuitum]|uniref:hypothetical protein n=1 Tax=Mycolicibacterium fortuitum TaxID=1766 RepID=UPI0026222FC7|nr:hypothetical protein [Mycolicibacterium fortuitum]
MPKPPARRTVAVIAQTKGLAEKLADQLGIDRPHLIGARMATALVGLRADRFLIDADAELDPRFMETVRYATRKTPGSSVTFVTVRDARG